MSLAETQRASSAVSPSPGVNGLVLAPLHSNVNCRGQKKKKKKKREGVSAFHNGAKSILLKQMVGRAWDFNHRNKARASFSSEVAIAERDGASGVMCNNN